MRLPCALSVLVCVSSVAALMDKVCFRVNQYSPFLNETFQFQPHRAVDLVLFRRSFTPYNHTVDFSEFLSAEESGWTFSGIFHKQEKNVLVNKSLSAFETFSFEINTTGEICAHLYHDNDTVGDATDSVMPAVSFIKSFDRFDEEKKLTHILNLASIVLLCLTLLSIHWTFNSTSGVSPIYQDLIGLVLIKLISALCDLILYLIGDSGLVPSLLFISLYLLQMLWLAGLYKLSTGVFGINATSLRGVLKMPILLTWCFMISFLCGGITGLKPFVDGKTMRRSTTVLNFLCLTFTKIIIFLTFKITAGSTENSSISHNLRLSRVFVIVLPLVILGVLYSLFAFFAVMFIDTHDEFNTIGWLVVNGTSHNIAYSQGFDWRSLIHIPAKDVTMFAELWALAYIWRPRPLNGAKINKDQEEAIELSNMD